MAFSETLKVIARGIARLAIMPMFVSYCARALADKDQAFRSSSQFLSLFRIFGDYLRRKFYRLTPAGVRQPHRSALLISGTGH